LACSERADARTRTGDPFITSVRPAARSSPERSHLANVGTFHPVRHGHMSSVAIAHRELMTKLMTTSPTVVTEAPEHGLRIGGRTRPSATGPADALVLTVLVARKDPGRHQRVLRAGSCATSRRILTRRSTKPRWPRRALSRSRVSPMRRRRRCYVPWPKERLADAANAPSCAISSSGVRGRTTSGAFSDRQGRARSRSSSRPGTVGMSRQSRARNTSRSTPSPSAARNRRGRDTRHVTRRASRLWLES
jgi:hypothetical protein